MRGSYTVTAIFTSFTTGNILEIKAPANENIDILEIHLEMADPKAREDLDVSMLRMATPSTGGGSVVTPEPNEESDTASSSTVKKCSVALTGESEGNTCYRRGYPVETGWHYTPIPENRKTIKGGGALLLKCNSTVTSGTLIITIDYVERG